MAESVKISELTELASGLVTDATILPAVSGSTTYHVKLSSIKDYLDDTLATDSELLLYVNAINSFTASATASIQNIIGRVDGLDGDVIDLRVMSASYSIASSSLYGLSIDFSHVSQSYINASSSLSNRVSASEASIDVIESTYAIRTANNIFNGDNIFYGSSDFAGALYSDSISSRDVVTAITLNNGIISLGGSTQTNISSNQRVSIFAENNIAIRANNIDFTGSVVVTGSVLLKDELTVDGLLSAPQFDSTQISGLSPRPGSIIWNTTAIKLQVFNGSVWVDLY